MRSASDIQPASAGEERLLEFDLREIDAPDQRSHFALKYVGRLEGVLRAVERHVRPGGVVLEVGSAQANISLLLAERGYQSLAVDLMPEALAYARRKHQQGVFWPVCAAAEALPVRERSCDAVLLGELLEHCAYPARVLEAVCAPLREGGVLVITTPNGARVRSTEPTYTTLNPAQVEGRQFGPGGEDHLFAFTAAELVDVVRQAGLKVMRVEYHASMLHTDRLGAVKRLLSPDTLRLLTRLVCRIPVLGPRTALTLMVVAAPAAGSRAGRNQDAPPTHADTPVP